MSYPIGILDYGIGGVGLAKLLKSRHPDTPIFYFSDSGATPYGRLSKGHLSDRLNTVLDYIFNRGVEHVVIACHSASSVIGLQNPRITTITKPTIDAVSRSQVKSIGVIGGGRTIKSQLYRRSLETLGIYVKQRIAQELSIFIERGEVHGRHIENTVRQILQPIRNQEGLLLACTHYPVIIDMIRRYVGDHTCIIDPIESVYHAVLPFIDTPINFKEDLFCTTGDPEMMRMSIGVSYHMDIERPADLSL